jgi:predicted DCC family thiol-disulfide oxidoreductase YuxK
VQGLLIYDTHCPYCRGIVRLASLSPRLRSQPYQSGATEDLLDTAFHDPGFTLYLFYGDQVYWGSEAAEKTTSILHLPRPVSRVIYRAYPYLVRLFTILSQREQEVALPSCTGDVCTSETGTGGTKDMDDETRKLLEQTFDELGAV